MRLWILCLVVACSAEKPPTSENPNEPAKTTSSELSGEPSGVEIVSAGDPPRHTLRWQFREGPQGKISMVIDVQSDMTIDGEAQQKTRTPAIYAVLDLSVAETSANGSARVVFEIEQAKADRSGTVLSLDALGDIDRALTSLTGLRGSFRCTSRGLVDQLVAEAPEGAPPIAEQTLENIRQSIPQMITPLPAGEVGHGARWNATGRYPQRGMMLQERATYQVQQLEPPFVSLNSTIEQTAEPQTLRGPKGQPGDLESLQTRSTGSNLFDLSNVARVKTSRRTSMTMTTSGPGVSGVRHQVAISVDFEVNVGGPL
ncbi:MAG: hypothetical protein AAF500_14875 [Myxococcota bacterium]